MTEYIYLSPHPDDAVLSCGAILYDQVHRGHSVQVWTVLAGDPPPTGLSPLAQEIHQRWQTGTQAASLRRAEDRLACERLQVIPQHFTYLDCIYRTRAGTTQPLIEKNAELFQPLPPSERPLIEGIAQHLRRILPPACTLVLPLGIGNHVDHQLVRQAGEALGQACFYYADFPYIGNTSEISSFLPPNSSARHFPLSKPALTAWQYAVEAYTSQLSTFWTSLSAMHEAIAAYARSPLGNCLWVGRKN